MSRYARTLGALAVALAVTVAHAGERGVLVRGGEPESILQGTSWALLSETITAVAFSPDGSLLASGGDDHWVQLWEVSTGRELMRVKLIEPVQALAFSPSGKALAASDSAGRTWVWDVHTGRELRSGYLKGFEGSVETLAFLSDSELAALGKEPPAEESRMIQGRGGTSHQVWNLSTGEPLPPKEALKKAEDLQKESSFYRRCISGHSIPFV